MNSRTWTIAALLLAAGATAGAADARVVPDGDLCRDDRGDARRPRHCEVREAMLSHRPLQVDARPNGGIHVRGWDRSEVRLRVRVTARAEDRDQARALASQVRVETDGAIRAVGPQGLDDGRQWSASFHLDVPREAELALEAANGGLHLSDVLGRVSLSTTNGGIHLEDVGGRIEGRTTNGGLHVRLAGSEWEGEGLDLATTNGGVHLEVPTGYNARLVTETVNGGVHSDLFAGGDRRRGRRGGRVAADLGRGGATLKLATTNGGLHIERN